MSHLKIFLPEKVSISSVCNQQKPDLPNQVPTTLIAAFPFTFDSGSIGMNTISFLGLELRNDPVFIRPIVKKYLPAYIYAGDEILDQFPSVEEFLNQSDV
ncbi:MAG: hypothetical protein ChlgKO_02710 [Chlamydiales bacterium]